MAEFNDEHEEIMVDDDDLTGDGLNNDSQASEEREPEDRGDVVTVEEEEDTTSAEEEKTDEDETEESDQGDGNEKKTGKDDQSSREEEQEAPAGIPVSRVSEISREKNASVEIADGVVNGTLDQQQIQDLGGAKVVAKAIATGELNIENLKASSASQKSDQKEPVDLDAKWQEYHEIIEDGEFDQARELLKEIRTEENRQTRKMVREEVQAKEDARVADAAQSEALTMADKVIADHPVLADQESAEYKRVLGWAQVFQGEGHTRATALQMAANEVLGPIKVDSKGEEEESESDIQEAAAKRKREAILRNAKAAKQQPPFPEKGTGSKGIDKNRKVKDMTEDEFDNMSEADKKRARGD